MAVLTCERPETDAELGLDGGLALQVERVKRRDLGPDRVLPARLGRLRVRDRRGPLLGRSRGRSRRVHAFALARAVAYVVVLEDHIRC